MSKKVKWIISLSLTLPILMIISYYGYSFIHFGMQIQKGSKEMDYVYNASESNVQGSEPAYEIPEWEGKERVNILLLGADGRADGDSGRSDTIMVVSIDPMTKKIHLFSVLRDTYVEIEGYRKNKINAAFAYGGPELSMKAVSDFMGLPIHYYFYLELDSFIQLVDSIGGVDYYVEKDMKYIDTADKEEYQIDLKEGLQHLDGNKALQYVRFRKDALSDFTRTERQRNFLKAVADKMQTTSNLINLPHILNQVAPYIETNMDLGKMLKLASLCYNIKADSIVTLQAPPMNLLKEEKINGSSVITIDPERLKRFVEEQLSSNDDDQTTEKDQSINNAH